MFTYASSLDKTAMNLPTIKSYDEAAQKIESRNE
jgi:hypothetical protein